MSRFWRYHALLPALLFAAIVVTFENSAFDTALASHFYDSASHRWPYKSSWWSATLIHEGGRKLIALLFIASAIALLLTWLRPAMRGYRRPAGYLLLALLAATGSVSASKRLTNVDCPWDLDLFGGTRPYVHLFSDRPDDLPRGQCFPGGHSSAGFALFGLYFLFRERKPLLARLGLTTGVAVGALFAFGQEARGAHFLSHDLWSAFICWFVALGIYALFFKQQLWPSEPPQPQ